MHGSKLALPGWGPQRRGIEKEYCMSVERANGWIFKTVIIVLGWFIMEVVSAMIHVWLIKRSKVCPYIEEANRYKH